MHTTNKNKFEVYESHVSFFLVVVLFLFFLKGEQVNKPRLSLKE